MDYECPGRIGACYTHLLKVHEMFLRWDLRFQFLFGPAPHRQIPFDIMYETAEGNGLG